MRNENEVDKEAVHKQNAGSLLTKKKKFKKPCPSDGDEKPQKLNPTPQHTRKNNKKNKKLQAFYTKIGVEEKNKESISKSQSRNNNNMRGGDD